MVGDRGLSFGKPVIKCRLLINMCWWTQDIKSDFEKRAESNSRQINQLLAELDEHGRDFRSMTEAHLKTTQETYGDRLTFLFLFVAVAYDVVAVVVVDSENDVRRSDAWQRTTSGG